MRRPSSSTFSNDCQAGSFHISHIASTGGGNEYLCFFYFDRIRTLVAMATYASHRLIMEKSEYCLLLLSCLRYLNFVFAEMFIE